MLGQSRLLKGYALGPKRKTNVIVHQLSLRQCSFTNWRTAFLLVSLPPLALSLFAQVANDTVLNEPQWAPPPTFSACNAMDCVIGPAEVKLQTRITSRKSKDKYWIRAGLSHKRRQTEGEREPGWKSSKLGQRTSESLTTHSENQRRVVVNHAGHLRVQCTEVVMEQSCLEFIWSCHAVPGPLSVISLWD